MPEKRIVNGAAVPLNDKDWNFLVHVELYTAEGGAYTCGGSVINANFVLTAAHCINWYEKVALFQNFAYFR